MKNSRRRMLSFFVGICLAFVAVVGGLVYWPTPEETACRNVPAGTVVLALAFTNLGEAPSTGRIIPGKANERIAEKLEQCAGRFRIVLTQKAVSDALENEQELKDGVPVVQMHKHNKVTVRTLEALCCAIERLQDYPGNLVVGLIAHDKHFKRSRRTLEAVLQDKMPGARIVDIHLGKTPYQDEAFYRPWWWAIRELAAMPLQFLQAEFGSLRCSEAVSIPERLPYSGDQ